MRDRVETDDIIYGIDRAYMLLSNKNLPTESQALWLKALRPFSKDEILDALEEHINGDSGNDSKYAPKPKHIIDLIRRSRDRTRGHTKNKTPEEKPCDPKIEKAWVIFMGKVLNYDRTPDRYPDVQMSFEEALKICNQQAAKHNTPDAIPNEYKLPEYWTDYDVAI